MSLFFYCLESEIALNQQELEENNENTVVLWGNINTNSEYIYFPKLRYIKGDVDFNKLTTAKGLNSLQTIGGNAWFSNLTVAEGLDNLQIIGYTADFGELTTAKGLNSLQTIGGYAWFNSLTTAEGLNNLQSIGCGANLVNLKTAKGLKELTVNGEIYALYLQDEFKTKQQNNK